MQPNKLLNYAIWATVIGGGLFLLYKKFGKGNTRTTKFLGLGKSWTIDEIAKEYPNWKLETSKRTGNPYYSKSFWTLNQDGSKFKEMWFIFYNNNTWKIYTRATPEVFVSGGNFTKPTSLEVTDGFNKGNLFSSNSLSKTVEQVLNQKVSDLPTN